MFTLSYTPGGFKAASNLLPVAENLYESRPGFFQVVGDNINRAIGWNDACLMEVFGGVHVWHGGFFQPLTDKDDNKLGANLRFSGSRFQSIVGSGLREERIYIGDGTGIFYIHRKLNISGTNTDGKLYQFVQFDNEFLDAKGKPYSLPRADCLATWRNRLWASDGTHIIYHCRFDNPSHWEPLDAIQIQGGEQSEVTGLCTMGNRLIVSTFSSLWQVVGDSPYNWEYQAIVHGHGAVNDTSMATDGTRLFYLDQEGLYELGKTKPVSEPIKEAFFIPAYKGQILLDAKGEYLYCLIAGRLFVYNTWQGGWGEITTPYSSAYPIKGLAMIGGNVAFYGEQGLWISSNKYTPDVFMSKARQPVNSRLRTWSTQPNNKGEAAIDRCFISIEGAYETTSTYRVYSGSKSLPMAVDDYKSWLSVPEKLVIDATKNDILFREQSELVNIELPLGVSSQQFEHEIESTGYVKIWGYEPSYQFSQRET